MAKIGLDEQLRRRLAEGAFRHARAFSWERTTDALLEGYAQAAVSFRRSVSELAGAEVAV
jgi:D-inositol-3-phosphate glycosyltransferase